jgi:NitT/TauT family transport system ATP-binding protein
MRGDAAVPATVIAARNVSYRYPNGPPILESFDLEVGKGEIVVLIGPSGCGKSTVLNLIAGILKPTTGRVESFDAPVNGFNRRVTYMTQKDTLLPWRNCLDNASLPLEIKGVPRKQRYERAQAVLALVGVAGHERARPHQLSGGMRSRLSLARSLLSDTDIFLMDEPFAAVDALTRVRLQQELLTLWQTTHKTMVYVTHDLDEAITLGHRVVVMSTAPGRVYMDERVGAAHPRNAALFKTTPEARALHLRLWSALEKQFTK